MEHIRLPTSLLLVWDLRRALEKNQSLHKGIQSFLERQNVDGPFRLYVVELYQNQFKTPTKNEYQLNSTEKWLLVILKKGLQGVPIYDSLLELDQFMTNSCEEDIQRHIILLPLLMQIPLLGLIFPAILILLLVPALNLLKF